MGFRVLGLRIQYNLIIKQGGVVRVGCTGGGGGVWFQWKGLLALLTGGLVSVEGITRPAHWRIWGVESKGCICDCSKLPSAERARKLQSSPRKRAFMELNCWAGSIDRAVGPRTLDPKHQALKKYVLKSEP